MYGILERTHSTIDEYVSPPIGPIGGLPEISSNKTTPKLYTSLRVVRCPVITYLPQQFEAPMKSKVAMRLFRKIREQIDLKNIPGTIAYA